MFDLTLLFSLILIRRLFPGITLLDPNSFDRATAKSNHFHKPPPGFIRRASVRLIVESFTRQTTGKIKIVMT
jgi:hypothetical protein